MQQFNLSGTKVRQLGPLRFLLAALVGLAALLGTPGFGVAAPHRTPSLQADVIDVGGILSTDATWTAGNVYRITRRLTLSKHTVLTIEPGAVVKFNPDTELVINGDLIVAGTAAAPIVFTSIRDDSAGGDSNADGNATSPAPGDWNYIRFNTDSTARIAHARVRYGGSGFADAMLYAGAGTVHIADSVIAWSATAGLRADLPTTLEVKTTRFDANVQQAATIGLHELVTWQLQDNSCSANGLDAFRINGELAHSTNLADPGCPLLVGSRLTIGAEATLSLTPGTVVKLDRGAEIVNDGIFVAEGTPAAPIVFTSIRDDSAGGDSANDDTMTQPTPGDWDYLQFSQGSTARIAHAQFRYGGGNTRPAGALGAFGGAVTLRHVLVEHSARDGLHGSFGAARLFHTTFRANGGAGVYITDVAATEEVIVQQSVIADSQGHGMRIDAGQVTLACITIADNRAGGILVRNADPDQIGLFRLAITGNQGAGLTYNGAARIAARNLWWGAPDGPSDAGPGSGDAVGANVGFAPWLTAAPTCAVAADPAQPYLQVSYPTGLPGSEFTVRGFHFPPNAPVRLRVHNQTVADVQSDAMGTFVFVVATTDAAPGFYTVDAASGAQGTASIAFDLLADAPQRARDNDAATAPRIALPAAPATPRNAIYLPLLRR